MIISFVNQKGGAGKTTLAVNIAHELATVYKDVLLVDADPQQSALQWSAVRADPPLFKIIGFPKPTIHKDLPALADKFDHVVIDAPPRVSEITRSILLTSDKLIIPVSTSPLDIWAAEEVVNLIDDAKNFKEFEANFVVNRAITNSIIAKQTLQALHGYNIETFSTVIPQRVAFPESMVIGKAVRETEPSSSASIAILSLLGEIIPDEKDFFHLVRQVDLISTERK